MSNGQLADHVAWSQKEAERAFGQAARARRRASITHRLLRRGADCARLPVHDGRTVPRRSAATAGVREISLDAISGTLDPGRAREFASSGRRSAPASAGRACGSPSTREQGCRRSTSSRSATPTPSATATTACQSPARGAVTIDAIVA